MLLYTKEDLVYIQEKIEAGKLKFPIERNGTTYKMLFSKQGEDIFIQRISNFALGLIYIKSNKKFVINYPHIENAKENELPSLVGVKQTKKNGTNLGIGFINEEFYWRTRGTFCPDKFVNDINRQVSLGAKNVIGINEDVFTEFKNKYLPIYKEGREKGIIDDYGAISLNKVVDELKEKSRGFFSKYPKSISIFGELCSKFNPISLDDKLRFGIYLDMNKDFEFHIFDIAYEDDKGNIYLDCLSVSEVSKYDLEYISALPLLDYKDSLTGLESEEGIVIKGTNSYLKYKQADVLAWARLMGKISGILQVATNHVFEQSGLSKKQVIDDKIFLEQETLDGIVKSIWEEIGNSGITRENLVEYYITKKRTEKDIDYDLNDAIENNLMLTIAGLLKENEIDKSKLYLEIPKYIKLKREAIYFDIKKNKWRPNNWYSPIVSRTIGKTFLS